MDMLLMASYILFSNKCLSYQNTTSIIYLLCQLFKYGDKRILFSYLNNYPYWIDVELEKYDLLKQEYFTNFDKLPKMYLFI